MNAITDDARHAAMAAVTHTTEHTPSLAKRVCLLMLSAVQLGLLGAAWISLARRDADEVNGPKWFWFLASFVNFVGPIAYLLGGRKLTR